MNLPHTFQFRVKDKPSHTHTAKRNAWGDYEVKWARGWYDVIKCFPLKYFLEPDMKEAIKGGDWLIVENKPKVEEKFELPDEFLFESKYFPGEVFKMSKLHSGKFRCTCFSDPTDLEFHDYCIWDFGDLFAKGIWKIIDKPTLTPEQKKANAECYEQINALKASIRIQEQDIEHKIRLIDNYTGRINDLEDKIMKEF